MAENGLEMTTIGLKRPEMVLKWLKMLSKTARNGSEMAAKWLKWP